MKRKISSFSILKHKSISHLYQLINFKLKQRGCLLQKRLKGESDEIKGPF